MFKLNKHKSLLTNKYAKYTSDPVYDAGSIYFFWEFWETGKPM